MTNTDSIVAAYLKKHDPAAYIAAPDKACEEPGLSAWLPADAFFGVDRAKKPVGVESEAALAHRGKYKWGYKKDGTPKKAPGRPTK